MDFREALSDKWESFDDVIIYGHGEIGSCVLEYIINWGIENEDNYTEKVKYFAHTSKLEPIREKGGIPIKSIWNLQEYADKALVIIAAMEKYQTSITAALDEIGFQNRIYITRDSFVWLRDYNRITEAIKHQLEKGGSDFVIYPYGERGKLVKQILNCHFKITEKYIVDDLLCESDEVIQDMDFLRSDYQKNYFTILLAADPDSPDVKEHHRKVAEFASVNRITDVSSLSTYFIPSLHYGPVWTNKDIRWSTIECISREIYLNKIEGAVAEAGVYKGGTACYINAFFPDRKLYLFDTFSGFDVQDQNSDDKNNLYNMKIDYSRTSVEEVMEKMLYPQNCIIKAGWFPESAEGVNDQFCFVRLDMDLYNPIKAGLDFFYPKMVKGGYICVHDCRSSNFDGARKAVIDFCKEYGLNYMCMPDSLGTAVICIGH